MNGDMKTLLLIGGGLLAYYLIRDNKLEIDEPKRPLGEIVDGSDCASTCGGYNNPYYNPSIQGGPQDLINKPCICEGPGTAQPCPEGEEFIDRICWNGGCFMGCATPKKKDNLIMLSMVS